MISLRRLSPLALACLYPGVVLAQFDTVIDLPPGETPTTIFSNTQVNLNAGGAIELSGRLNVGDPFGVSENAELNVHGGQLNVGDLWVHNGGVANFYAGNSATEIRARSGGVVNVFGGTVFENRFVGGTFVVDDGSTLNIEGGKLNLPVSVLGGGTLAMSGGELRSFSISRTATGALSGGAVRGFTTEAGSQVTIFGGDFRIDGQPIASLGELGDRLTLGSEVGSLSVPSGGTISGVLADGTPFSIHEPTDSKSLLGGAVTLESALILNDYADTITASIDPVPLGVRSNQKLIVDAVVDRIELQVDREGVIEVIDNGDLVRAKAIGSMLLLHGGRIGRLLAVDSTFRMTGGRIYDTDFYGSNVEITAGEIDYALSAVEESEIVVSGDVVARSIGVGEGSRALIMGGANTGDQCVRRRYRCDIGRNNRFDCSVE